MSDDDNDGDDVMYWPQSPPSHRAAEGTKCQK